MSEPKFQIGDRVFSHYVMDWGTVMRIDHTTEPTTHGVTGSPLPASTWYRVAMDKGTDELLDDGGGDWDLARIVPPEVAERFGYGSDIKVGDEFQTRAGWLFRIERADHPLVWARSHGTGADGKSMPFTRREIARLRREGAWSRQK